MSKKSNLIRGLWSGVALNRGASQPASILGGKTVKIKVFIFKLFLQLFRSGFFVALCFGEFPFRFGGFFVNLVKNEDFEFLKNENF